MADVKLSGTRCGATTPGRTPSRSSSELDASRAPKPSFGGGALERRSISEQVANRILSMIKSGNLKARDRLPTEQQMGIAFGISRPPLREALKALTLMGVLESRQGGRYTVTDLSPSAGWSRHSTSCCRPATMMWASISKRARSSISNWSGSAPSAPRPSSASASTSMRSTAKSFYDDAVAFRLLDIEFHQSLNDAAGNRLLTALAQSLYDIGLDVRRVASAMPGNIETRVGQHIEVAEAVMEQRRCGRDGRLPPPSRACARHDHRRHGLEQPDA